MSFQDLKVRFGLTNQDHFRYLDLITQNFKQQPHFMKGQILEIIQIAFNDKP